MHVTIFHVRKLKVKQMKTSYRKTITVMLISLFAISILSTFGIQMSIGNANVPETSLTNVAPIKESSTNDGANFTDAEAIFTVYPDGKVALKGSLNMTPETPYEGPATYGTISFKESGGLTLMAADITVIPTQEMASEFPLNATTFDFAGNYSEGLLDGEINTTTILPTSFASQFPFNVTDFTLVGELSDNQMSGTVTFDIVSGFLLDDIVIDIDGNLTDISFNGSATVIYNVPFGDLRIDNKTALMNLLESVNSTFRGRGAGSLYNMTGGLFEITYLDYSVTPHAISATVDFEVNIHGGIIDVLAFMISSYVGYPGYPGYPGYEDLYSALNTTFSSIESSSIQLAYAHAQKKVSAKLAFVVNVDSFIEGILEMLPETTPPGIIGPPPGITGLIESLLNTTFCSVNSTEVSLSYADGRADLEASVAFEGDFDAEVNYVKSVLMLSYYYALPTPEPTPAPWQILFINETEVDLSRFKTSFNITETSIIGNFEGLTATPPIDTINATNFKLKRFFNLTSETTFPTQNESLSVTVIGGSNGTHKVILYNETGVPEPDLVLADAQNRTIIMAWNNVTLSDLQDLQFIVVVGAQVGDVITDPESVTAENPFIINANETLGCIINITEVSDKLTIMVSNVTEPPMPTGKWKLVGTCIQIIVSNESATVNATIRMYYTDQQIEGLDENSLTIHYWNATLGEWVAVDSHVNTEENYVWAIVNHFSKWTVMGQTPTPPFWMQWWFWTMIAVIIVVIVVAFILIRRRRKVVSAAEKA